MTRRRVTVIDPDRCSKDERSRVDRWLVANGARYQAVHRFTNEQRYPKPRRIWQRIPLGAIK